MKRVLVVIVSLLLLLTAGCQSTETLIVSTPAPAPTDTPLPTPSSTPVPTAVVTPTPVPQPTSVNVMVVGDLLCLGAQLSVAKSGGSYNFDYCFEAIKDTISSADLAIGNLETLVAEGYKYTSVASSDDSTPTPAPTDSSTPTDSSVPVDSSVPTDSTTPTDSATPSEPTVSESPDDAGSEALAIKPFSNAPALESTTPAATTSSSGNPRINAPESFLTAVLGCGFDVLTNANNHIFDYKADGLAKTMKKLDAYKVPHTGAYAEPEDKKPLVVDVKGIKLGILAYTNVLNNKPGSSQAYMVDRYDEKTVTADIKAAREAGADFIVVCVHWGTEHTHKPTSGQRKMAAFIANAGADIILGSHPHCTQPFESIETDHGTVPVLYSMGNFISSMGQTIHKDGVIVSMTLEKAADTGVTKLKDLSYIPTLCAESSKGRFVIYPADLKYIAGSPLASRLEASRQRTIDVLTENIAKAQ
jgi:poly-gamma-glutamate capsule biosynthesis protein CapA/YwtB (metallophosphatase superfamily)